TCHCGTFVKFAAANVEPTSPSRTGDDGSRIASKISETPRSVRTTCATHGARNPSTISNRSPDGSGRASGARGAAGGGKFPEAADDGALGGAGEFQERRCPVHRHADLLARARNEISSLHRLGDDSKPMTAFRPTIGGPWDQETAVLETPHVRDPDAVDVEVHKWIGMPGPSTDLDGPSDRGAARRLQNRGPARVEPRVPQQLRAGLAGNREFHGQVVRPRMF